MVYILFIWQGRIGFSAESGQILNNAKIIDPDVPFPISNCESNSISHRAWDFGAEPLRSQRTKIFEILKIHLFS